MQSVQAQLNFWPQEAVSCLLSLPGGSQEEVCDLELQPTRPHQLVSEVDSALWESVPGLGCPGLEWAGRRDSPKGFRLATLGTPTPQQQDLGHLTTSFWGNVLPIHWTGRETGVMLL